MMDSGWDPSKLSFKTTDYDNDMQCLAYGLDLDMDKIVKKWKAQGCGRLHSLLNDIFEEG